MPVNPAVVALLNRTKINTQTKSVPPRPHRVGIGLHSRTQDKLDDWVSCPMDADVRVSVSPPLNYSLARGSPSLAPSAPFPSM